MPLPTTIPHADFGDPECCGCLVTEVHGDIAVISCDECGTVLKTIPASELQHTLDEMESKLDLAVARCRYCGAVNLQPGFDRLVAFVCDRCGNQTSCRQLRELWIEENIQRSNPPVADDYDVQPGVIGSFAFWPRTPGENASIVKSLGFSIRRVNKMRVGRTKITSELVQSIASDEHTWWNIEYAILSVELVYGRTATSSITLTEDLL
jgi:hypothetical protein